MPFHPVLRLWVCPVLKQISFTSLNNLSLLYMSHIYHQSDLTFNITHKSQNPHRQCVSRSSQVHFSFFLQINLFYLKIDRRQWFEHSSNKESGFHFYFCKRIFPFPRSILDDDLKTHLDRKCVKSTSLFSQNGAMFVFQIQPRQRSKHSRPSKVIGIDFSLCRWNLFVF